MQKLRLRDNCEPDISLLKTLHRNHLYEIPFENLDIHSGKKIILDKEIIAEKILLKNRGGYCYELNGMFYFLLTELGFKVSMHSARVNNGKGGWGKEFDHLVLIVKLDDNWLVDVGFGDNFIEPILLFDENPQSNPNGFFKIGKYDNLNFLLSKSPDNKSFTEEYIFDLKERNWSEFSEMNLYHQTSPESHFTQNKLCTIATNNGRITLTDKKLIITENGSRKITKIKNEEDFKKNLMKYFKIKL